MAWQAQVNTGLGSEGWGLNREMIGPGDDTGSGRLEISIYNFAWGVWQPMWSWPLLSCLSARADDANFQRTRFATEVMHLVV